MLIQQQGLNRCLIYHLGFVLLPEVDDDWKPVAYVSCTMSDTERGYREIENELLVTHGHFSDLIVGKNIS